MLKPRLEPPSMIRSSRQRLEVKCRVMYLRDGRGRERSAKRQDGAAERRARVCGVVCAGMGRVIGCGSPSAGQALLAAAALASGTTALQESI
jgi:hypothetical protein